MEYNTNTLVRKMVLSGMLMALTVVGTMVIRIPIPATQGYVHIGDSMIIIAIVALGWKWGSLAGSLGEMLADLFAGYAIYAPITLMVKLIMAMLIGLAVKKYVEKPKDRRTVGDKLKLFFMIVFAGAWMVFGYYAAQAVMYGSMIVPLVEVPANAIQYVAAVMIGIAFVVALSKTTARKYLTYK